MKLVATLRSTDGGKLEANKKGLEKLDWFGKLLLDYREKREELKFIKAILENQVDNKIRIPIKVPGTITSRCSAGNIE